MGPLLSGHVGPVCVAMRVFMSSGAWGRVRARVISSSVQTGEGVRAFMRKYAWDHGEKERRIWSHVSDIWVASGLYGELLIVSASNVKQLWTVNMFF